MDFYDAVRARRSVRDFAEEKIPEIKLRKMIEAAYQAPANDHFRDWHYIVITDPETKRAALGGVPQNLTEKDVDQMTFISDAWQEGAEGTGTDVISCWNLYQNGELISCDLFGKTAVNEDVVTFAVMFPFMDNISGLALVPEYSDAGEKPGEAIVLEPMDQESLRR